MVEKLSECDGACVGTAFKKDGKFELLGMTTEATLSDNGKYLMVYTDNSGEELNKTRKSDVLKAFKEYKK